MLHQFRRMSELSREGDFSCADVIGCVFNLTETDLMVFEVLSADSDSTSLEVADKIKRDRSTAHRSLEKLVACGIARKMRRSKGTRGYSNAYRRITDRELYVRSKANIDECYKNIEAALKGINK